MAVPKRKTSPSRRGMRRSADALKQPTYIEDKDSGELRRPHHIDLKTGMYKGRQVLKAKADARRLSDQGLRGRIVMYLVGFPLLLIPFAIYNMIAFLFGAGFSDTLFSVPMLSGATLNVTTSDLLIILSILLLFVEILKATRVGTRSIIDHMLSFVLFIVMAGEFLIVPWAATSTFLLMLVICVCRRGRRLLGVDPHRAARYRPRGRRSDDAARRRGRSESLA